MSLTMKLIMRLRVPSFCRGASGKPRLELHFDKPATPRSAEELLRVFRESKEWLSEKKLPITTNPEAVFANDELNLKDIAVYGFDYDYTLATYKTSVEELIHDVAKRVMVEKFRYPAAVGEFVYSPDSVIRGLHYDIEKGLLLKLDNSARIQFGCVYRGRQQLSDEEVLSLYKKRHLPKSVIEAKGHNVKMVQLVDAFSKPMMCLLMDTVDWFKQSMLDYLPDAIYNDVRDAVASAHPSFHQVAAKSPSELLDNSSSEGLKILLERLRNSGKTVFLVTNSPFNIVDGGMSYMLSADWQDYFDLIIIRAGKPDFFTDEYGVFREYSPKNDRLKWKPVHDLEPTKVYAGGTLRQLQKVTGWNPDSVLYFGDHVFADLADVRSQHGWRTGAVIQDLEEELSKTNDSDFKWRVNWTTILCSTIELNQDSAKNDDGGRSAEIINEWKRELKEEKTKLKEALNLNFGSVFRTHDSPTYFSSRLLRYADIYTSKVTNFNRYSIDHHFLPRRGVQPHEFKSWFV